MAEPEHEHAPVEHGGVHLPPPSFWPITTAIGLTLVLTGLVFNLVAAIVGAIISLASAALWIRDARRELHSLPDERHHG